MTKEEIIARENKNGLPYQCPTCRKNEWQMENLNQLLWKCLSCKVATYFSERYLSAYWEGYRTGQAELKKT